MAKTKTLTVIAALAVVAAAATLPACNTTGCTDNHSSIPVADFYSSTTGGQVTIDSLQIHGIGAPGDSVLLHVGQKVNQVNLPMRSSQNSTAWCFSYKQAALDHPGLNDTITFDYDSEPWFASEQCGAMYRYHITRCTYTTHLIDSVAIADSLITNSQQSQIRIYFRTAAPGDDTEATPQRRAALRHTQEGGSAL